MKETMNKLSQEIDQLEINAEQKQEIQNLMQQLKQENQETAPEQESGSFDILKEKIEELEVAHPALTKLIGSLSNLFSNSGI